MKEHDPLEVLPALLTLPQFRWLLNTILDEKLKPLFALLQADQQQSQAEYLTTKQALDLLHLSKPTLNKLRRLQIINSYYSSDKRVLYKRSELIAYLESHK
ncbi:helix-turn-helix domain-containing protein [Hymenobacter volaticus]|uniref:Helix-turn-helix domain-containing protein n=1 Tax=Hymenobacter volaticus TaxID=2932254 RepID=A0ABY4G1U1_9BACT|nr:helix-turn-helix domain-containing protein [Hymenobacter volaticus]UOQ64840.1 helix-turn-helix domain-containing protein [Hymenobacter volaticus]